MNKKIIPLFLLAFLLSISWMDAYKNSNTAEISFPLSNNPEESTEIVIKNKELFIRWLPETDRFNYVMLKLVDGHNELPMKKCKNIRKDTYDVRFDLRDVPNGTYYIEIYSASEKFADYLSYIKGKSICIEIDGASVDFVEPFTMARNEEIFESNHKDDALLTAYMQPSTKIESDHPVIIEHAYAITAGLTTDYEKSKAVHDWVSKNIWYDYDELYSGTSKDTTALETLLLKKGVCLGYASLTAALLRSIGVPTKLVTGYVLNASVNEGWTEDLITGEKSNHVWNEAYIDGRWIIIDTTYDSNNVYKNQTFSDGTGMKNRKYFDISLELLSTDRCITLNKFDPVGYR